MVNTLALRAKVLNSGGFGFVAVGTLMQMLAIVVSVND